MNGDRESFAQSGVSRFREDRLLSLAERNEAVHVGPQKADDCFLACRNSGVIREIPQSRKPLRPGMRVIGYLHEIA